MLTGKAVCGTLRKFFHRPGHAESRPKFCRSNIIKQGNKLQLVPSGKPLPGVIKKKEKAPLPPWRSPIGKSKDRGLRKLQRLVCHKGTGVCLTRAVVISPRMPAAATIPAR